jgi:lysophospholipase L1-like esterase
MRISSRTRIAVTGLGLACALALAGPVGTSGAASPQSGRPVRVMLAGDSLTQGFDGDYTWRYRLDRELVRQHVNVDLVGPKKWPKGGHHHYLATGWDTDHDGTAGTRLLTQVSRIADDMRPYQPDILVSYLGTNDLVELSTSIAMMSPRPSAQERAQLLLTGLEKMRSEYAAYLQAALAVNPHLKVVLGQLVTRNVDTQTIDNYNDNILPALVSEFSTPAHPIVIAHLRDRHWASTSYLYDGTHPTPTGETLFAQRFAQALDSFRYGTSGLFPGPIRIQQASVAWNPALRPKIVISDRSIAVDLGRSMTRNRATAMRVKLVVVRTAARRNSAFGPNPVFRTHALQPGTYRIRVQVARKAMISAWSRVYTIQVRTAR